MDYSEYIKDESELVKLVLNSIFFHCDNELDAHIFELCVDFASELSKFEKTEYYKLAEAMEMIPAQYVLAILKFARKENIKFLRNAKLVQNELSSIYIKRFLTYSHNKQTEKLVKLSQNDYKNCLDLKRRMFDLTERMYIMERLFPNPIEAEMGSADTEEKRQLKELKKLCFKNVYFKKYRKFLKEKFEDVIMDAKQKLITLNVQI